MVRWFNSPITLENVDLEIQILGLKRPVLPFVALSGIVSMVLIHPLLFWIGPATLWYLSWRFSVADEKARSIEYQRWFQERLGCSTVYEFFKTVKHIRHGQERYR
jgi:hypothetical protein